MIIIIIIIMTRGAEVTLGRVHAVAGVHAYMQLSGVNNTRGNFPAEKSLTKLTSRLVFGIGASWHDTAAPGQLNSTLAFQKHIQLAK